MQRKEFECHGSSAELPIDTLAEVSLFIGFFPFEISNGTPSVRIGDIGWHTHSSRRFYDAWCTCVCSAWAIWTLLEFFHSKFRLEFLQLRLEIVEPGHFVYTSVARRSTAKKHQSPILNYEKHLFSVGRSRRIYYITLKLVTHLRQQSP